MVTRSLALGARPKSVRGERSAIAERSRTWNSDGTLTARPDTRHDADFGGLDGRTLKALAHPLRFRVLARLNRGVASPVEIARELGVPVGRVSHHVRTLAALGAIELVRTRPRRGAVEHFYRATLPARFSDEDWARVPPSARQAIDAANLTDLLAVLHSAAPTGFEHPRSHLSYAPLELDEQAMRELSDLLSETLVRASAIEAASAARRGPRLGTEIVLLHFERGDAGGT
jgi:DNA-binding transcriptional ArsR family regulator